MLTSTRNPIIQNIRKLQTKTRYRRETGLFVIEGARLAGECLSSTAIPETVLFTAGSDPQLLAGFREKGVSPIEVSEAVMSAASDTKNPQGVLAVVRQTALISPDKLSFSIILDGVRDPGNVGTILRTAAAAGADLVVLAPGCADPFSPKVVRAGMGAHFQIPVLVQGWDEIRSTVDGLHCLLADAGGELVYTDVDYQNDVVLIIGGEAFGADEAITALQPDRVHIPMPGGAESLNAAVAAGILIFEVVRQRNA